MKFMLNGADSWYYMDGANGKSFDWLADENILSLVKIQKLLSTFTQSSLLNQANSMLVKLIKLVDFIVSDTLFLQWVRKERFGTSLQQWY